MADDEETPLIQQVLEDEGGEQTGSGEKPKKEKKKKSKRRKDDDIKTHMSNERTFFKWLFFGFHIGGFGTFILTFFPAGGGRVYVVLFVWLVAFFFMYYGLFRYLTRRRAMKYGAAREEDWDDPIAPALMTIALFLTVGAIIFYAVSTSQVWQGLDDAQLQPSWKNAGLTRRLAYTKNWAFVCPGYHSCHQRTAGRIQTKRRGGTFAKTREQLPHGEEQLRTASDVVKAGFDILFFHAMDLAGAKEDQRRIVFLDRPQLSRRPCSCSSRDRTSQKETRRIRKLADDFEEQEPSQIRAFSECPPFLVYLRQSQFLLLGGWIETELGYPQV